MLVIAFKSKLACCVLFDDPVYIAASENICAVKGGFIPCIPVYHNNSTKLRDTGELMLCRLRARICIS